MKFFFLLSFLFLSCSHEPGGEVRLPSKLLWGESEPVRSVHAKPGQCPIVKGDPLRILECVQNTYALRGWDTLNLIAVEWKSAKDAIVHWTQKDSLAQSRSLWVGPLSFAWIPQEQMVTSLNQRDDFWRQWGVAGVDWGHWMERFPKPLDPKNMFWMEKELLGTPIESDLLCQRYSRNGYQFTVCRGIDELNPLQVQGWKNRWVDLKPRRSPWTGIEWVQSKEVDILYSHKKDQFWIWYGHFPLFWGIHWFDSQDLMGNSA